VHPDLVRQVFTGDPDVMRAGEANDILRPLLGSRSVLLLDGPEHVRQRKLLMPPFHGERVMAWARTMQEVTARAVDTWRAGSPFALHPHMQRITLEVILRTVFGVDEGSALDDLRDALTRVLDRQSRPIDSLFTLPPLRRSFLGLSPWDGFLRDREDADALIYRQIAWRRAERAGGGAPRADVLAMLLDARDEDGEPMTDGELRDELVTLLVAGHETTATALAWALRFIAPDRPLARRLRDEIATADGDPLKIAKLELLDGAVKEALRLQPVIPMVGRLLAEPATFGKLRLPAGAVVAPSIYLVHHRPDLYPEPERFNPDRYATFKPATWELLPFGGGLRRCIGAAFAMYEMKMVLAAVLSRVEMQLAGGHRVRTVRRGITMTPSDGLPVVVTAKKGRSERKAA
jgi:cytochrome P450